MKVALISTYPPAQCGIGNYTRELRFALANAAPDIGVIVLAERTPHGPDTDTNVTRCWDRRGNWIDELAHAIGRAGVDAIHIQHEESHFGQDDRLVTLLGRVRALGVRSFVTMHSIYDRVLELPGRLSGARFHRRLAAVCDGIVAHQRLGMADVLAAHRVPPERIHVIPHGTPPRQKLDTRVARRELDLPADRTVALFFGFIHPKKNVLTAVRAFERVKDDLPSACLVIAGRPRDNNILDRLYVRRLEAAMRAGIDAGRIIYRPGFIPIEHKPLYYAATDLLLLPHHQSFGSASGVLHEGLAARRAILCSRGKKFAELVEELAPKLPFATPRALDVDAWEVGMERLLGSAVDRHRAVAIVERLADVTTWQVSATKHADLYRAARGGITNISQVR